MLTCGRMLAMVAVSLGVSAAAWAQTSSRYQPVEQYTADMNPLSLSLRRLHIGIARPTGFQDVFHVPGEPGKFMRVHGSVHAVFPQSMYGFNEDEEIQAEIPPNTVFRIGPRAVGSNGVRSLIEDHPGLVMSESATGNEPHPYRILAEGFGREAVLPRPRSRTLIAAREDSFSLAARSDQGSGVDNRESLDAPGTIIGDEQYRRERLHALMRQAAERE